MAIGQPQAPAMPPALQGLMAGARPIGQAQPTQPANPDTDPSNPDYEGPEDGPFRCDNCTFYADPNQCSQPVVMKTQGGQVDPAGCCKFFNSMAASTNSPAQPNSNQASSVMHQYGK